MDVEDINFDDHKKHYDDESFWEKVKKFAAKAGCEVIYAALKLYFALQSSDTPVWAKSVIVGALGYFILPIDLIPDVVPVVGFSDDLSALAAALVAVAVHITPEIKEMAKQKLQDWFGPDAGNNLDD